MTTVEHPCRDFFHEIPVAESGRVTEVHSLRQEQTVEEAINMLGKYQILSAPVLDESGALVGVVDMLDISKFLLSVVPDSTNTTDAECAVDPATTSRAMAFKTLKEVMSGSTRDPPTPLNGHNPSSLAVDLFASGIHRCPIVGDDDQTLIGLVSQSTLVRRLAEWIHRGKLKELGQRSLKELGLGQSQVSTATLETPVIQLIRQLDQEAISAMALVDPNDEGRLVGNFSISDLRGLWHELVPHFSSSAKQYLELHHPTSLVPFTVPLEFTLCQTVQLMAQKGLHRVWTVIPETETPTYGVVTLTDLMKLFRAT